MSETSPLPEAGDPLIQRALETLNERLRVYEEHMQAKKAVDGETGARMQHMLWVAIRQAMAYEGPVFIAVFSRLLAWVNDNRHTCCGERYINRFLDQSKLRVEERRGFSRLFRLLQATADPRTRKLALKQINVQIATAAFRGNGADQRIMDFYGI